MHAGSCFGLISVAALAVASATPALAQEAGDAFIKVSAGRTKMVDKGEVRLNGTVVPGADYTTRETYHATLSGGYFVVDHVAVDASISSPVTTDNTPAGSIGMFPNLGNDELVIATLGASVHPFNGKISPYVGTGAQFQFITRIRDLLADDFKARNSVGPYVKAGLDVALNQKFGLFVEGRKAFYDTTATGQLPLGGGVSADVNAKAKLDPVSINIGMTAKFGPSANKQATSTITTDTSRWVVRLGYSALNLSNEIDLSESGMPGAGLSTFEHHTATVQLGYFLTDHVAINATAGIPPTINVYGADAIGKLPGYAEPKLGRITYGPTALTAQYHPFRSGLIRPYVGAGVSYMFVFNTKDGAFENLWMDEDLGPAVEAGIEFMIANKAGLFFDAKKAWLRPKASGDFGGGEIKGRTTLDPLVVSAGLSFHF